MVIVLTSLFFHANAQVVIGTNQVPLNGMLLQLKETENWYIEPDNATKGLLLPRVKLTDPDKLYPMYKENIDYENGNVSMISNINNINVGLLVYNYQGRGVLPTTRLENGLYVWTKETINGSDTFRWVCVFKQS